MPLYEYRCAREHTTELLRSYTHRDDPFTCQCGAATLRIFSHTHCAPDGVYSYAPNLGSESAFEQRRIAMKNGVKVMPKIE